MTQPSALSPQSFHNKLWLAVIPFVLLAALLGARRLDSTPMWGDEFDSIRDAGGYGAGLESPLTIWAKVGRLNPWHTPGYFILLNDWAQWVGWETFSLRWLSVLVGVLGIAWTYRLGAEVLSPRAGLFAAGILATSAIFNDQMQDIRMHVFNGLLTPLVFWLYLRLLRLKTPRPLDWLGLFLGALAMLYTHYFVALPLATLALYHLFYFIALKRRVGFPLSMHGEGVRGWGFRWWAITGIFLLAGLLFLPWVTVLVRGMDRVTESERMQTLALHAPQVASGVLYLFSNGAPLLFLALAALALTARTRGAGRVWFFALAAFAVMLVANEALGVILPHRFRYTTSLWPLFALVAALGLVQLRRYPALQWGAFALWIAVALVNGASPSFAAEQDDNVADTYFRVGLVDRALRGRALEDDALIEYVPDGFNPDDTRTLIGWHERYREPLPITTRVMGAESDPESVMNDLGAQRGRLWLATMPDDPAQSLGRFNDALAAAQFQMCEQPVNNDALRLSLFAYSPVCCHPDAAPTHRYGDGIAIVGVDVQPRTADSLPITIAWSVDPSVPDDTYSATLQLWDAERQAAAQLDSGLDAWRYLCQRSEIDVGNVPAGEYGLWAAVYDWRTGARLPGTDLTDGGMSDFLHLGDVRLGE